ncbi:unnamed protein product [Mytilus coruscus]|uniref:DNA 3'-5' helicase n=1 Tax=Mytilus coruscus TaxID=42192 RepID=A0A6J8CWJ4_MYTCO|nr:unnamed protein product [Mytilus coruscus]
MMRVSNSFFCSVYDSICKEISKQLSELGNTKTLLLKNDIGRLQNSDMFSACIPEMNTHCLALLQVNVFLASTKVVKSRHINPAFWGEDFRPKFKQIGELTALFPNAAHLAVTATATTSSIQILSKTLQYINPTIIQVNPDRPNFFLEIKTRLSKCEKFNKYDDIVVPLAQELKTKRDKFPLTIVYVESLEDLGYFYQFINYELKEEQYISDTVPENRIVGQFHKDYTTQMKQHVLFELRKEEPKLRLVLATVALGMGLDAPGITRIIHCRPPTTLEKYFQEVGRAGRKGQKAEALMYFNNSDLAKNCKGLSDAMVQYCRAKDKCLRLQLLQYFCFNETQFNGPVYECCSYCRQLK